MSSLLPQQLPCAGSRISSSLCRAEPSGLTLAGASPGSLSDMKGHGAEGTTRLLLWPQHSLTLAKDNCKTSFFFNLKKRNKRRGKEKVLDYSSERGWGAATISCYQRRTLRIPSLPVAQTAWAAAAGNCVCVVLIPICFSWTSFFPPGW